MLKVSILLLAVAGHSTIAEHNCVNNGTGHKTPSIPTSSGGQRLRFRILPRLACNNLLQALHSEGRVGNTRHVSETRKHICAGDSYSCNCHPQAPHVIHKNEHYVIDDVECRRTCGNRLVPGQETAGACVPYTGYVCDAGYVRLYDNATGPCIAEDKCAPIPTECGVNEEPTSCRIICPPQTCESIRTSYVCELTECEPGCNCLSEYLRDSTGVCIRSEECTTEDVTPPVLECSGNKMISDCAKSCPESCESINANYECPEEDCIYGCVCKPGYRRNAIGDCIPSKFCPPAHISAHDSCNGDKNAVYNNCPSQCPLTCDQPNQRACNKKCAKAGCVCKPGFILNKIGGKCIKPQQCPVSKKCDDPNASYKECRSACAATCADYGKDKACSAICLPAGCECNPGYVLTKSGGICVKPEGCPAPVKCTRPNEEWNPQPSSCLAERCEDITNDPSECIRSYPYDRPACVCKPGYYRNDSNICVPASECFQCEKYNATYSECPGACPATCNNPNSEQICNRMCLKPGCVCLKNYPSMYLLDEIDGSCILPEDCPGGSPTCGANKTFEQCIVDCPNKYCPVDIEDSARLIACDPPYPCPSGCTCQEGYLILSQVDKQCVLSSNCPPLDCSSRPNEEWKYVDGCLAENCNDIDGQTSSLCFPYNRPACVCRDGYYRNGSGVCVPADECFRCDDPNASYSNCRSQCPEICGNLNSTEPCILSCAPPGCACNPGYVLTQDGGKCVLPENCPVECGNNATYNECGTACPATCLSPEPEGCIELCVPGCMCNRGYLLNDGVCVLPKDCPGGSPTCGANETYVYCKVGCPTNYCPVDDNRAIIACDPPHPCPSGCACKGGYYKLSEIDDKCILATDCPPVECTRPNEVWDPRPSSCRIERCGDIDNPPDCDRMYYERPSCVCKEGYYRNQSDICVPVSECLECGNNATYNECGTACPATCLSPEPEGCIELCVPGCMCNRGYLLNDGFCVLPKDCPGGSPTCGANETYVYCKVGCPTNYCPVDDNRAIIACDPPHPCPSGCACKGGYYKLSEIDDKCILATDCPPVECTRPNEVWDPRPSSCRIERCGDIDNPPDCDRMYYERPTCVCKEGYYRNQSDICVPVSECPHCDDPNASYSYCPSTCPAVCGELNSTKICTAMCAEPGCVCNSGYVFTEIGGRCVLPENCPVECGANATFSDCGSACPATCSSPKPEICIALCVSGCFCNKGYILNPNGNCVLPEDCPVDSCSVPVECRRTCARPNPENCPYTPAETNIDDCECQKGYILLEEGGNCIKIEDCPDQPCHNDPNARVKECPLPCPSTCDSPNAVPCKKMCYPIGCECKDGYMFSKEDGQCVLPDECPGGDPCGPTAMFSSCNFDCPHNVCPQDDSRDILLCKPPRDCLPGCVCRLNHKRISYENRTCIESSTCPPVECTRPNEVWSGCPSECLAENCEDIDKQPSECATFVLNCQPKCICEKDHFRNADGICIPASECPPRCSVPPECRRTCKNPNPENCPYEPADSNIDGCNCESGYILSEEGGTCIKIEDCASCKGDPYAIVKQCPAPCPSTCSSPNEVPCKRACYAIGCECAPGYIYDEKREKCILPDDCPGGNPCGQDGYFSQCRNDCPNNYCPVNDKSNVICDPSSICLSGCMCDINHKKLSQENQTCVVSSSCPPVDCTRPNEVWNSCPSACLAEQCDDIGKQPVTCNTLVLNCEPKCVCRKNHFRNKHGKCVTVRECRMHY